MSLEIGPSHLPHIKRVDLDEAGLEAFKTEEEFTGLGVDLMVETASYACVAASLWGDESGWDRDHAAVAGNVVRLYKLLDGYLDQTCKRREEISTILARLVFETAVNVRYLISNFSKTLIDSYVTYSLRPDRKLQKEVQANIDARKGIMRPIEDRMLQSINRLFKASEVDGEAVDANGERNWDGLSIFDRTREVGLESLYNAAFGLTSHSVHGNWAELYGSHLEWDEGHRFKPRLGWRNPRPQMTTAIAIVVLDTLSLYFEFVGGESAAEYFKPRLSDLSARVRRLAEVHEIYLAGKTWPEI
jgi:hypothetical protein